MRVKPPRRGGIGYRVHVDWKRVLVHERPTNREKTRWNVCCQQLRKFGCMFAACQSESHRGAVPTEIDQAREHDTAHARGQGCSAPIYVCAALTCRASFTRVNHVA